MSEKNYIERYWRDATPEDAIKEPPMVARLRDNDKLKWSNPCELRGWIRRNTYQWIGESGAWSHCQVYDAPDPGEGWRLVDPSKESPQDGDEVWSGGEGIWKPRMYPDDDFTSVNIYRRRITPAVTYVPFTWEDREQLRGRWMKFKDGREVECTKLEPVNHGGGMVINCYTPLELLQNATFLDTGKPVGKEVTSAN